MKKAYLWVADFYIPQIRGSQANIRLMADLFFSSKEKFEELHVADLKEFDQLVEVNVPDDFDNWDFIPDNY